MDAETSRQLGDFLQEQLEILLTLRQSVLAIQTVLERDPKLSEQYKACLQSVKADASRQRESAWATCASGLFGKMRRAQ